MGKNFLYGYLANIISLLLAVLGARYIHPALQYVGIAGSFLCTAYFMAMLIISVGEIRAARRELKAKRLEVERIEAEIARELRS